MIAKNQIWKLYGTEYKEMTKELLSKADLAGLIGGREKRVAIKPNLVVASPAEFGATTHPEVVAGIVEYLQENQFENIVIVEQKDKWHEVDCAGMKLNIIDAVDSIDFLINVPVLKGHCQTKMTCSLKNLKGLIPNTEKSRFHRMGLHKPIAHLQAGIRQDFIVVDHICGDLDFEEGGNPVVRNCVMAAADPVLVDSYACSLLHYTPDDVPYVRMAEQLGIGSADLDSAQIIDLGGFHGYAGKEMKEDLPREHKILEVSYAVNEVDSCSACYASLSGALWRLKEEGLLDKLDTPIGIGQGMQGKTGKLGVGKCTKDFDVCIMGCPPDEDKIYNELKAYILR